MTSSTHSRHSRPSSSHRSRPSSSAHSRRSPSVEIVKTNTIQEYIAAINDIPVEQVTDKMVQEHIRRNNNGGKEGNIKREREDDEDDEEEQPSRKKSRSPSVDIYRVSGDEREEGNLVEENPESDAEPGEGDAPEEGESDDAGEPDVESSPREPEQESESEAEAEAEAEEADNITIGRCAGTTKKGKKCNNWRRAPRGAKILCERHSQPPKERAGDRKHFTMHGVQCWRGSGCGGCWKSDSDEE